MCHIVFPLSLAAGALRCGVVRLDWSIRKRAGRSLAAGRLFSAGRRMEVDEMVFFPPSCNTDQGV